MTARISHGRVSVLGASLACALAIAGCGAAAGSEAGSGTGSAAIDKASTPTDVAVAPGMHAPKTVAAMTEWATKGIRAADANGDGTLTLAEVEAFKPNFGDHSPAARFAKADTNGDGFLDATEVPARMWSHLSAADADGDGKVTLAEIETARANGTLGRHFAEHDEHGHHPKERLLKLFHEVDTAGSGVVDVQKMIDAATTKIAAIDLDHDGILTRDEMHAARAAE